MRLRSQSRARTIALGTALAFAALIASTSTAQLNLYSTLEVDTTAVSLNWFDGMCSLREAILNVNSHGQGGALAGECEAADGRIGSTIVFDPAVFGGGAVIALDSRWGSLPAITADYTTVDGWSAGGSGYTGPPLVTLDGSGLADSATAVVGVSLDSASSSVRGLAVVNFASSSTGGSSGILVKGGNNSLYGNYVGLAADGATAAGNTRGITVAVGALGTLIGSNGDGFDDAAERNVVSGNDEVGIQVLADGTIVAGNYIGTDAGGLTAVSNPFGIISQGTVIIGGDTATERNVIAGNTTGIAYTVTTGDETPVVRGNYIGTDRTGLAPLPNDQGVLVGSTAFDLGSGSVTLRDNVISGNSSGGLLVESDCSQLPCVLTGRHHVLDNFVGLGADGTTVVGNGAGIMLKDSPGNLVRGNYVAGNADHGIRLDGARTGGNMIEGNVVGLDADYQAPYGQAIGVHVSQAGGNTFRGNIISGNSEQVEIDGREGPADANVVTDNWVGADPGGQHVYSCSYGIAVAAARATLLQHNTIKSCYEAIALGDDAQVESHGNLMSDGTVGLSLQTFASVTAASNDCIESNSFGITNSTGATVVLESTWWGDASGPSGDGPGTGDSVSADVDFDPWLTTRPDCGVRLLFLDDFESADTHYWSSTTP